MALPESDLQRIANFSREEDDFMMSMKADRNKVEKITTKEIRDLNEEFLFQKGITIQKKQEEVAPHQPQKPQRVPGAPSPEPKKRKRHRKKKADGEK